MSQQESTCPALSVCEQLKTVTVACYEPETRSIEKDESLEANRLFHVHARLEEMQNCLASIVLLLSRLSTPKT